MLAKNGPYRQYRRATLPAAGWRSACYLPWVKLSSDPTVDPAVAENRCKLLYPPGSRELTYPTKREKENHLQNAILGGYLSFLEGTTQWYGDCNQPLPSQSLTARPLKNAGWKTSLSYWEGNLSGANCWTSGGYKDLLLTKQYNER